MKTVKKTERSRVYPMPKTRSVEALDRFLEEHSPLTEGYGDKLERATGPRLTGLTVRFSRQEMALLRAEAGKRGMSAGELIRFLVFHGLEQSQAVEARLERLERRVKELGRPSPLRQAQRRL